MKKLILFAASAVAVLASCTQNEEFNSQVANDETPISFGTYLGQGTRAAATGNITSAQVLAQKNGFGVFAYYTESTKYTAGQTAYAPNFMNNQQVKGTDATTPVWSYSPIKYWPNANTTADNANATGKEGGLVSFFAYAPYADAVGTTGITSLPSKSAAGDPVIGYKIDPAGKNVDLLWGTSSTATTGTNAGYAGTTSGMSENNAGEILKDKDDIVVGVGKVNSNLTKQKVNGKIGFNFKHALAKLGGAQVGDASKPNGLQVKLDVDALDGGALGDENTRVTIQSITITNDLDGDGNISGDDEKTIPNGGSLNLATGVWTANTGDAAYTLIKNVIGRTGDTNTNATLKTALQYSPISDTDFDATHTGVTVDAQNVYETEANPIVLIPGTQPTFAIKIVYNVTTKDAALAGGFSDVQNTITKKITFTQPVEMNKMYNFLLRLGLTSVKVEADVIPWDVDSTTDGDGNASPTNQPVNLPINVQ